MDIYTQDWKLHSNIILYAFDYCLGRHTYAGSEFIKNVKANQHALNEFMIDYMIRSIKSYLQRENPRSSDYSSDVEVHWRDFLHWLQGLNVRCDSPQSQRSGSA